MRSGGGSKMGYSWWGSVVSAVVHSLPHSPRKQSLRFGGRAHLSSCYLTLLTVFACFSMLRFLFLSSPSGRGDGCLPSSAAVVATSAAPWVQPLAPRHVDASNMTALERSFWQQPDGAGFVGCIQFTPAFQQESAKVVAQRDKYLMVAVNGGLNQQRNQIVDSVVMARVLGASLVIPILEVNPIWEDER
jgi:hypothetical protein